MLGPPLDTLEEIEEKLDELEKEVKELRKEYSLSYVESKIQPRVASLCAARELLNPTKDPTPLSVKNTATLERVLGYSLGEFGKEHGRKLEHDFHKSFNLLYAFWKSKYFRGGDS